MHTSAVVFEGRTAQFRIVNPRDYIQGHHAHGLFYEQAQLLAHRDLIPIGGTILDVGSNIGNHAIFYALHTFARYIYVFEPNIVAREILSRNIAANPDRRGDIRTDHAHFAIGAGTHKVRAAATPQNNLGATSFETWDGSGAGGVDCRPLDQLSFLGPISFLKIDVEGMELDVLLGAAELIARHRPSIAIEVQSSNEPAFGRWLATSNYIIVRVFIDYLGSRNFLVVPAPWNTCRKAAREGLSGTTA
jgi:FkbM family methyltransferase